MLTVQQIREGLQEKDLSLTSLRDAGWSFDNENTIKTLKEMLDEQFTEFLKAISESTILENVYLPGSFLPIGQKRFIAFLKVFVAMSVLRPSTLRFSMDLPQLTDDFGNKIDLSKIDPELFSEILRALKKARHSFDLIFNYERTLTLDDDQFERLFEALAYNQTAPLPFGAYLNKLTEKRRARVFTSMISKHRKCLSIPCNDLKILNEDCFNLFTKMLSDCQIPLHLSYRAVELSPDSSEGRFVPVDKLSTERFNIVCRSIHYRFNLSIDYISDYKEEDFNNILKLIVDNRICSLSMVIGEDSFKIHPQNDFFTRLCKVLENNTSIYSLSLRLSGNIKKDIFKCLSDVIEKTTTIRKLDCDNFLHHGDFIALCEAIAKNKSLYSIQLWKDYTEKLYNIGKLDSAVFPSLVKAITKNQNIVELSGLLGFDADKVNASAILPLHSDRLFVQRTFERAIKRLGEIQQILTPRITLTTLALTRSLKNLVIEGGLPRSELPDTVIQKILTLYSDKKKLHDQVIARELPKTTPKVPLTTGAVVTSITDAATRDSDAETSDSDDKKLDKENRKTKKFS